MTWYENAVALGHLKVRFRPPGEDVSRLEPRIRYRVPWDDKGHIVRPETLDTYPEFFCGRGVYVDPDWYTESGMEAVYGPWYVLKDTREGEKGTSRCTICKQKQAAWKPTRATPPTAMPDTPLTASETEQLGVSSRLAARKLASHASWVAEALNGRVIDE